MNKKIYFSKVLLGFGLAIFILTRVSARPFNTTSDSPGEHVGFSRLISGTYVVSRNTEDGPSRILTIFADGNVSSIQSIQFENNAISFSNQQGSWKRTGKNTIKAVLLDMSYDNSGNFDGIGIGTYDLNFGNNYQTMWGKSNGQVYKQGVDPQNPNKVFPIATFTDQFTAERVIVPG